MDDRNKIMELNKATQQSKRGIILNQAAIGDCILTLPVAKVIKESFQLETLDYMGHSDYINFFPGRTCIDTVYSAESFQFYKFFINPEELEYPDVAALTEFLTNYTCIIAISGRPHHNFQKNLTTIVNHNPGTEVIILSSIPPDEFSAHLSQYYIRQIEHQYQLDLSPQKLIFENILIKPAESDFENGRKLLHEIEADSGRKLVIIHPGSGGRHKCWHLSNYLNLAGILHKKGFEVVFLVGPAELERYDNEQLNAIKSAGKCLTDLSLHQVLQVLSCADAFIGNDSGVTHLAAGLGIQTIAVFGPSNPLLYRPLGPRVNIIKCDDTGFVEEPCPALQEEILNFI